MTTWDEAVEELALLHLEERKLDQAIQERMANMEGYRDLTIERRKAERRRHERRMELEPLVGIPSVPPGIENYAARPPLEHELIRSLTRAFTARSLELLGAA